MPRQTADIALISRRVRAALALREVELEEVARRAQVSSRHLTRQLRGESTMSRKSLRALEDAIGPEGIDFASGKRPDLRDPL